MHQKILLSPQNQINIHILLMEFLAIIQISELRWRILYRFVVVAVRQIIKTKSQKVKCENQIMNCIFKI